LDINNNMIYLIFSILKLKYNYYNARYLYSSIIKNLELNITNLKYSIETKENIPHNNRYHKHIVGNGLKAVFPNLGDAPLDRSFREIKKSKGPCLKKTNISFNKSNKYYVLWIIIFKIIYLVDFHSSFTYQTYYSMHLLFFKKSMVLNIGIMIKTLSGDQHHCNTYVPRLVKQSNAPTPGLHKCLILSPSKSTNKPQVVIGLPDETHALIIYCQCYVFFAK
ncbi:hypothetical protein AGLY_010780, partial [Aphis glycines]